METYNGELLHTAAYRRPEAYTGQRVVVVGGNSAIQIAVEFARWQRCRSRPDRRSRPDLGGRSASTCATGCTTAASTGCRRMS
jgi:hypothetical protein